MAEPRNKGDGVKVGDGRDLDSIGADAAAAGYEVFAALPDNVLDFGCQPVLWQAAEEVPLHVAFYAFQIFVRFVGDGVVHDLADAAGEGGGAYVAAVREPVQQAFVQ